MHHVRLYCVMDESPYGLLSFEAAKLLRKHKHVESLRLISAAGAVDFTSDASLRWRALSPHILTPLVDPFVQIICAPVNDWAKVYTALHIEHRFKVPGALGPELRTMIKPSGVTAHAVLCTVPDLESWETVIKKQDAEHVGHQVPFKTTSSFMLSKWLWGVHA